MKVEVDIEAEVLTIYGVKYAFGLFSHLGFGPVGTVLRIEARENGVVTLSQVQETKEQAP